MGMFVHSYYLSALSGGMKRERGGERCDRFSLSVLVQLHYKTNQKLKHEEVFDILVCKPGNWVF